MTNMCYTWQLTLLNEEREKKKRSKERQREKKANIRQRNENAMKGV